MIDIPERPDEFFVKENFPQHFDLVMSTVVIMKQTGILKDKSCAIRRLLYLIQYRGITDQEELLDACREIKACGTAVTEKKMLLSYGEIEGRRRWESYCNAQSVTNTFEYKKEKYGMTKEEFDVFNASRAVTKENLIRRHGEEKGMEMWNNYCERQAYAGCKKEYFIEKYGEEIGQKRYEELSILKGNSPKSWFARHGDQWQEKLESHYHKRFLKLGEKYSSSHRFFDKLEASMPKELISFCIREYVIADLERNKCFSYDWYNSKIKLCIEYNGIYFHAKPSKFSEEEKISKSGLTAGEIWKRDDVKKNLALAHPDRVKHYHVVWEDEEEKALTELLKIIGDLNNAADQ